MKSPQFSEIMVNPPSPWMKIIPQYLYYLVNLLWMKFFIECYDLVIQYLFSTTGTNRLTGTGTVYIEVEDVNDNAPMFDRSSTYVGHVAENQEQHQDILTVTATDADSGPNAQIRYNSMQLTPL